MNTSVSEDVQSALVSRGVRDVKFFFSLDVNSKPNSEVVQGVTYVLETYLRGDCSEMPLIGDNN